MRAYWFTVCALLLSLGGNFVCSAPQTMHNRNIFAFSFDNQDYEIISTQISDNAGYNVLVRRVGGVVVLSAKDIQQDGVLDTMVIGDLTLREANAIYRTGIAKARRQGKYAEHLPSEVYTTYDLNHRFVLQTYFLRAHTISNKFIVYDNSSQTETVFSDRNADGKLDDYEKGDRNRMKYQNFYQQVLQQGLSEGRIIRKDNKYLVH